MAGAYPLCEIDPDRDLCLIADCHMCHIIGNKFRNVQCTHVCRTPIGRSVGILFFHSGQPIGSTEMCLQIEHMWFLDFLDFKVD